MNSKSTLIYFVLFPDPDGNSTSDANSKAEDTEEEEGDSSCDKHGSSYVPGNQNSNVDQARKGRNVVQYRIIIINYYPLWNSAAMNAFWYSLNIEGKFFHVEYFIFS